MKHLNTIPIEEFLEKSKIAIRTNQKHLTLTIKDVEKLDKSIRAMIEYLKNLPEKTTESEIIEIKMDGGKF